MANDAGRVAWMSPLNEYQASLWRWDKLEEVEREAREGIDGDRGLRCQSNTGWMSAGGTRGVGPLARFDWQRRQDVWDHRQGRVGYRDLT